MTTHEPARVAPLVPVALAFAAGVAADRHAGPLGTAAWAAVALGLGLAGLALAGARSWRGWVGAAALLGACGALAGAWHHARWSDLGPDDLARTAADAPRPAWVRGVVREVLGYRRGDESGRDGVTRAVLDVTAVHAGGGWTAATGRALLTVPGRREGLRAGALVEATGALSAVAGPLNPGEFDYRAYLRAQGVRLRLAAEGLEGVAGAGAAGVESRGWARRAVGALGAVRAWSRGRLAAAVEPGALPLAEALLLGQRDGIDPDLTDAFARTGTTHLLAVSGLQMQVLAVAFGGLLRLLGLGRRRTFGAVAAATAGYAVLVGLVPSVVRSAAMTVTYCAAGLYDREGRPANALAAAALATLGLNPAHLFDPGCQLSFLAVAVIVWGYAPVAARVLPERPADPLAAVELYFAPRWRRWSRRGAAWLARGVVLSGLVWAAAVPLVALRFHTVSPVGVLLNVPLVPATSLALLAAGVSLGCAAVWAPLGRPAAWAAARLLDLTAALVRWGEARPWGHAFVPEPSWAWVLGFYLVLGLAAAAWVGRWPGRQAAAALLAGTVALGGLLAAAPGVAARAAPGGPPAAEVLAVGHGLAVVVETGGGRAVLYDCGRMRDPSVGRRVVAPALWARGVWRLDAVVLSHADADHYDGLPDLLERVPVAAVLVPEGFASAANPGAAALLDRVRARGVAVRTVAAGDAWGAGAARFAVRHPPRGWNPAAPDNARSVVLEVSWRGRRLLLTGDLEGDGLAALTAAPPAGRVDVLLAPHHGARAANPAALYDWARPAAVVVSQRPPPPGARDPLAARGPATPVWRTWRDGAVRLRWTEAGIVARGFLGGGPAP